MKHTLIFSLILVILLCAGCGAPAATGTMEPTASPAPPTQTAEPTPAATPEPEERGFFQICAVKIEPYNPDKPLPGTERSIKRPL